MKPLGFEPQERPAWRFQGFWRNAECDGLWVRTGATPSRLALEVKVTEDADAPLCQAFDDLGQFDVVIAADVLYEKEYATLVAQCLARALAPSGEAIIADPGRLALPAFRAALPVHGLHLVGSTTVPYADHVVKQQVQLLRIRHASAASAHHRLAARLAPVGRCRL